MDEQTLAILIFGSIVVAFAFFSSYMADRQKEREKKEALEARGHSSGESGAKAAPDLQQLL